MKKLLTIGMLTVASPVFAQSNGTFDFNASVRAIQMERQRQELQRQAEEQQRQNELLQDQIDEQRRTNDLLERNSYESRYRYRHRQRRVLEDDDE